MKTPKRIGSRTAALSVVLAAAGLILTATPAFAVSQERTISTPYGTLYSDVWHGDSSTSGNSISWTYQVSAHVTGSQTVESIKTTWTGSVSLRNSASWQLTVGSGGVGAGSGSSWQYVQDTKYWNNTNGARSADYRTNMVAIPKQDYRSGSVALKNVGFVKFRGDSRNWQITAAV
jgi:hypothetical protein